VFAGRLAHGGLVEHARLPQGRRTSRRGRASHRSAGLVCAIGVLSAMAPVAGKGAPPPARSASASLESLETLRGASGRLKAAFRTPGEPLIAEPPPGLTALYETDQGAIVASSELEAPPRPGVYKIAVEVDEARKDVEDLRVITLVPFAAKREGQIGSYRLG
jgi:hypothetical protein